MAPNVGSPPMWDINLPFSSWSQLFNFLYSKFSFASFLLSIKEYSFLSIPSLVYHEDLCFLISQVIAPKKLLEQWVFTAMAILEGTFRRCFLKCLSSSLWWMDIPYSFSYLKLLHSFFSIRAKRQVFLDHIENTIFLFFKVCWKQCFNVIVITEVYLTRR